MGLVGTLVDFTPSTKIASADVDSNFEELKSKFNTYAVLSDYARTITVAHTFAHANGFLTDTITERSSAAGVTVDGLLIKDGGIPEAAVTAHEAALTILESQITNAGLLARVGSVEEITAAWDFSTNFTVDGITESTTDAGVTIEGIKLEDGDIARTGDITVNPTGDLVLSPGGDLKLDVVRDAAARSTGVGTVLFGDATARDNDGFIRIVDTADNIVWIPFWDSIGVAE